MPAPLGPDLQSMILDKMGSRTTQSEHFQRFITSLTNEISTKWQVWINSMAWGGNKVVGSGLGGWSGVGNNGAIHASPFALDVDAIFDNAEFSVKTPGTRKFLESLDSIMRFKFERWIGTFVCHGNIYAGSSTATGSSPGSFNATNTPTPLITLGVGENPSGIQDAWEALLESAPDPVFNLSNPNCYTRLFTSAVSSTIEEKFVSVFLADSNGVGDTVAGAAAPGSGTGTATSNATGKVT